MGAEELMKNKIKVTSISSYIECIMERSNDWNLNHSEIWYRGVKSQKMSLLPGIRWRGVNNDTENNMVLDFIINSHSLTDKKIKTAWQTYSLMQHYGLPTRLLDWTKSPLIAAYFALESIGSEDCVVWCLDPYLFNKNTVNKEQIFVPSEYTDKDEGLNLTNYLPPALRKDQNSKLPAQPIALAPPYSNERIDAQQGCFTIHGSTKQSIDEFMVKESGKGIAKIIFPQKHIEEMKAELFTLGISVDSIYLDLNSLSNKIIEIYC